ncbi:hypothetical protein [Butyrivibrio fibrisolvens]|uniref:hypothetical protein n=1 Tax=Butyrivibrio fibrisolvens TaxID=831 RepID=UPI00041EB6BE|nr:hypothetical protein [Butyrivibrio fibrisolvens]
MGKQVYISADYDETHGDRAVVDVLHRWAEDDKHVVDYVDTAQVVSGSVSKDPDCRICDLKKEFNDQINASSAVIFIIGDKTADRTAGSACRRQKDGDWCACTPYKQNTKGATFCKVHGGLCNTSANEDVGNINTYSFLKHEFKQAVRKNKNIIIVYNSFYQQNEWLPDYMEEYENQARPFWIRNANGNKDGNYSFIKQALGYE